MDSSPRPPRRLDPRAPAAGRLAALLPALVLLSGLPAPTTAQSPRSAFEDVVRRYQEARAICADFEQRIEVRLIGRTVDSKGRVCQERPNLFSMRFTDPAGDVVVSDGESLWVYYRSLDENQVVRHPLAERPGGVDFFREFLAEPGVRYDVEEAGEERVRGVRCLVVELAPRATAAYRRAKLWIDPQARVLRRIEVHRANSAVRTLDLSNVELGVPADPETFIFEAPAGVRVVTPGRGSGSS